MKHVYIAAPFFNAAELSVVQAIEEICAHCGISHFSPRRDQPQLTRSLRGKARKQRARGIFLRNVLELKLATRILACIDDFDPGTIWEAGTAWGMREASLVYRPTIVGFSTKGHGLNLMLSESFDGFLKNLQEVEAYLCDSIKMRPWNGARI